MGEVSQRRKAPLTWIFSGGSDGRRSRDLTIFSRALYQLSYRAARQPKLPRPTRRALPKKGPSLGATLTGLEPATSAVTGRHANQLRYRALLFDCVLSDPNGIRTRAAAVKGRCPRPLNDGAVTGRNSAATEAQAYGSDAANAKRAREGYSPPIRPASPPRGVAPVSVAPGTQGASATARPPRTPYEHWPCAQTVGSVINGVRVEDVT